MATYPFMLLTIAAYAAVAVRAASTETLFSLPGSNDSWLENLAYRASTDTILTTRLDSAEVWSVSAATGQGTLLANVTASWGFLGITPMQNDPNVFYVAGLNWSATAGLQDNSSTLWKLTVAASSEGASQGESTIIEQTIGLPGIQLINGLASWDETTVLAADSFGNSIWAVDVRTGAAAAVLSDATMAGVNGVRVHRPRENETYIYYSSTDAALLARIRVPDSAFSSGSPPLANYTVETISRDAFGSPDDFALLPDGSAVVAVERTGVVHVALDGTWRPLGNGSALLAGATACALGMQGDGGGKLVYVSTQGTSGGAVAPGAVVQIALEA